MLKKGIIIFFALLFISLISCFGGGGSSDTPSSASNVKWGYLLPETKGIYYRCENLTGKTGPEGRFEYYEGKNVRFYLGGIELGTVAGQKTVTPFTLSGYDTVPPEIQDGATDAELDKYPRARNIMHFLLAINELYDNTKGYRYEKLVESLEAMHTELNSKTLDFNVTDTVAQFQARLDNLKNQTAWWSLFIKSCYAISLGGLNSINATLITGHITGINGTVNNYNANKPGEADQYGSLDYTGVSNPPVDGQILTLAQLNGVWIAEWDIYGDRANNFNPDSAYRDAYVQFPQKNYIVRFDGSQLEEDFICSEYQTYYQFSLSNSSDMRQGRYVKFTGPIASKQTAYANKPTEYPDYPNVIYYIGKGGAAVKSWPKDHFIGLWKANNGEYKHVLVDGVYCDKIISYSSDSEYAILTFPYVDNFDDGLGDRYVGDGQILFTKPVNGRVKVYGISLDSNGNRLPKELLQTIRKVADNTVSGAVDADFPVD